MATDAQDPRPWSRLPAEAADWLRPAAERIGALVIAAIPHEVEAFANEDDGRLREDIRTGVLVTLERFLQLVGTEEPALSEATAAVYARLGSEEAGERRGLESLLAAYRVGARLLFREMSMLATRAGADPHVLVDLGDAVFTYMDAISAVSAQGYAASAIEQAGERTRARQHLAELLVAGTGDRATVAAAARVARVEIAETYRAVVVPGASAGGVVPGEVGADRLARLADRGLVLPRSGDVLVLVPGPETGWCERVLDGSAAAVGPPAPVGAVATSVRLAERMLPLAVASGEPVRADEHLAALALTADPAVVAELRRRRLAAVDALRPGQRDRLLETLRSWLRHWGQRGPVARELFIHPQTVGYRLGQLRAVLGEDLDDPQARIEMLLVLEAEAAQDSAAGDQQ